MKRRRVLGASIAATALPFATTSYGQTASGAEDYRRIFGMPNYDAPSESLKFLNTAQTVRTAVPRDLAQFSLYVDRLPILRQLQINQLKRTAQDATAPATRGLRDPRGADVRAIPNLYHVVQWNAFALDMTSLDHTTVQPAPGAGPSPDGLYAEQIGPHRSSRALAIIHLAMFEAINAIQLQFKSYKNAQAAILSAVAPLGGDPRKASIRAAVAGSVSETMYQLYPNKHSYTELFLRKLMPLIDDDAAEIALGMAIGKAASKQILGLRGFVDATKTFADGSESDGMGGRLNKGPNNALDLEPLATSALVYPSPPTAKQWKADPITKNPKALGAFWKDVEPFVLDKSQLFLPPGPPDETTARFMKDYEDVRKKGGDPKPPALGDRHVTPTTRTGTSPTAKLDSRNETFIGTFWAYDATALLCAPPRLYNMIATSVALNEHKILDALDMARYLSLVNIVLADCAIAAWTAKYAFKHARPVTYFRENDPDAVEDNVANREWTPLGAPVSNGSPDGANMTPPFPSYPSGHAVFGGGLFTTLQKLLPIATKPGEAFTFVSDEYNGLNRGPTGDARPYMARRLNFTDAMVENARSRIFLGIHWQFDGEDGIKQGQDIANYILSQKIFDRVV